MHLLLNRHGMFTVVLAPAVYPGCCIHVWSAWFGSLSLLPCLSLHVFFFGSIGCLLFNIVNYGTLASACKALTAQEESGLVWGGDFGSGLLMFGSQQVATSTLFSRYTALSFLIAEPQNFHRLSLVTHNLQFPHPCWYFCSLLHTLWSGSLDVFTYFISAHHGLRRLLLILVH